MNKQHERTPQGSATKRRTAGRKNFDTAPTIISGKNYLSSYLDDCYHHTCLSLYQNPPIGEIGLEEFEVWAIERLKILNEIDSALKRNKPFQEIELIVLPMLNKSLPLILSKDQDKNTENRRKDYYSHFILKLCFSRSAELREKFVKCETIIFKVRFESMSGVEQRQFVQHMNLPWEYITSAEKAEMSQQLYTSIQPSLRFQLNLTDEISRRDYFEKEEFIKIPFEYVPELISSRSVFLKQGHAFVPKFQQINLLTLEFTGNLQKTLISTSHAFPTLDEEDRLIPILNHLGAANNFLEDDSVFDELMNSEVNSVTVKSTKITRNFPLCASHLMDGLTSAHHLKYLARKQFSLFLKWIGLSVDEALKFWASEFTQTMGMDKFEKEYKYNFRHDYGLEGSKIKYKPWDCRKILSQPRPHAGEYHGCPYRDLSKDSLKAQLKSMGLKDEEVYGVLEINSKGDPTASCTKVLELKTNGLVNEIVTHPNLYYDRMRVYHKKLDDTEGETAAEAES
ncbi:hypothetical protein WICPIJ_001485 [Wickerhamomyces pijperi]|uniref:DNA primase large subunit n=1 Tax=Wickerhamomyces pijperi TaxID=599730 RepID=A0A9P8QBI9_WICPI|nr:hypothetical protein WICPIJ_001485 [Wickerhamomyces pijperi]